MLDQLIIENLTKREIHLSLPISLSKALDKQSEEKHKTTNDLIIEILKTALIKEAELAH